MSGPQLHVAFATAPGWRHINPGEPGKINNQDAIAIRHYERGVVAVVSDGCGEQPMSSTGSDFGANLIASSILHRLLESPLDAMDWQALQRELVARLLAEVTIFAPGFSTTAFEIAVIQRFLFTALILVTDEDTAMIVSFGDGVIIIDDETIPLQPPIPNAPPYVGHLLLSQSKYLLPEYRPFLSFLPIRTFKLSELKQGIVIATDGLKDLLGEDFHHPALVQPLNLQRWLNIQTTERPAKDHFTYGRCSDDVSLVIVRTEACQARLFEERQAIAEVKQLLASLDSDVVRLRGYFKERVVNLPMIRRSLERLEVQLSVFAEKARSLDLLTEAIPRLEKEIEDLKRKSQPKPPSLLRGILQTLQSTPHPSLLPPASSGIPPSPPPSPLTVIHVPPPSSKKL